MLDSAFQALIQTGHQSPHVSSLPTDAIDLNTAALLAYQRDKAAVTAEAHSADGIEICAHEFGLFHSLPIGGHHNYGDSISRRQLHVLVSKLKLKLCDMSFPPIADVQHIWDCGVEANLGRVHRQLMVRMSTWWDDAGREAIDGLNVFGTS